MYYNIIDLDIINIFISKIYLFYTITYLITYQHYYDMSMMYIVSYNNGICMVL